MKTDSTVTTASRMSHATAFAAGLVFGLGLLASGMTQPLKVKAFLDFFGAWDPSLALVMGSAVAVAAVGFALVTRRGTTWHGAPLALPATSPVDARLLAGGVLFGAGWGLAGYCPGPALVAVSALGDGWGAALLFTAAMLAGMLLHDAIASAWGRRTEGRSAPASGMLAGIDDANAATLADGAVRATIATSDR